ncbi:serine/threonine-protein kinase [Streptomyces oceani]|uniref:non-specific serine/threonine protein kinase n=1 Tax=Streptomyces oceani TaxID=1075402 RepID=A0A1E7KMS5_9ACTN|nr:serine/threonine-protein kinase [Streptomyces oceani]OEV05210.1 hypothetical protein AN216_04050 [Streptomyces oceani]
MSDTGAEEVRAERGQLVAARYQLLERIGSGGMGTVWLAEDPVLGRQVALKKMHAPPGEDGRARATSYERTRREARSVARISHPNVVVVHDVVDHDGLPCIVMEYVPSRTLGDVLREDGPVSVAEAVRIGHGMIRALRAAHAAGVLHRDVKPGNVLLSGDGRVVLTDFGIAVATDTSSLTRTGEVIGSADYLAPERLRGGPPDAASDLWALGATLYLALEGESPFRRDTPVGTAYAISSEPPRPPERHTALTPLIEALLTKDPADRPSAEEVEERLRDAGTSTAPGPANPTPAPAGSASVQAPADPMPAPASGPPSRTVPQRRRGRRGAVAAAVAVLALVVASGAAFTLLNQEDDRGHQPPDDKPSHSSTTPPQLPQGYHYERDEDLGLRVPLPDGWRTTDTADSDLAYTDPARLVSLRVSAGELAASDQLQRWKDDKAKSVSAGKLPGYSELRMQRTTYRGMPAAVWEFTFQGREREFRAIYLGFGKPGGKEYALYLSAPSADWGSGQKVFAQVRERLVIEPG